VRCDLVEGSQEAQCDCSCTSSSDGVSPCSLRCFSFCLISFVSFLGVLTKQLRQSSIRIATSVRPSSWNRAAPTGRVFMFSAHTKTCPSISILFNFGNMCTCIYCVLYCLYCVVCIVSFMCIYCYLFCLNYCKECCHRVTTQLQLGVVVVVIIIIITLTF